jgi:cell division protein FtsN
MKKPNYTALLSVGLIACFFLFGLSYQSCTTKKKKEVDPNSELEDISDKHNPDGNFEDETTEGGAGYTFNNDGAAITDEETTAASTGATYSAGTPTNVSSTASSNASNSAAPYVVVAGNYLLEANADEMLKKLKAKGYTSCEKVVFDLSQYHTVIAGRYSSKSTAQSVSSELKNAGVDNYILKK